MSKEQSIIESDDVDMFQLSTSDALASKELILELSIELTNKGHTWSCELRSKFEHVISILDNA